MFFLLRNILQKNFFEDLGVSIFILKIFTPLKVQIKSKFQDSA
jgi:hypothetical protein